MGPGLLHLDQAYSYADAVRRKQTHFLETRNRSGVFKRVVSVHPLVGVMGNRWGGKLDRQSLGPAHQIVDGFRPGRAIGSALMPINFLQSQLRLLWWMARAVRKQQIDLIYAADAFYLGALAVLLGKLTRRPSMVGIMANWDLAWETAGALAYPRLLPSRGLQQRLLRWVLRNADWIEIAAEDSARYVERNGADPAKLVRLPVVKFIGSHHFAEPEQRGDPRPVLERLGIPTGRPLALCVSRLRPVKYPLEALDAMRLLVEAQPDVIGVFAGEGELRAEMEARIDAWGLQNRIFLPGNIDQISLGTLLPGSLFLTPIAGMALVEASLAGAVPVAYDVEWQPEFIEDGVNGRITPSRDPVALGKAAIEVMRDPASRARMSAAARRRALEFADPQAYARKERAAMQMILGQSPARLPEPASGARSISSGAAT